MAAAPPPPAVPRLTTTSTSAQPHYPQHLAQRRSSSALLSPASRLTSPLPPDAESGSATARSDDSGPFFSSDVLQDQQFRQDQRNHQSYYHPSDDRAGRMMQNGQRTHGSPLHNGHERRRPQYRGSGELRNGSMGSNNGNGLGPGHGLGLGLGSNHGNGNGQGPLSVPVPAPAPAPAPGLDGRPSNGHLRAGGAYNVGVAGFDGPRSPPGNKSKCT